MGYAPSQTWNLDSICPGGPGGDAFQQELQRLTGALRQLVARADALPAEPAPADLGRLLLDLEAIQPEIEQIGAFAGCHAAADAIGEAAQRADQLSTELYMLHSRASVVPNQRITRMPDGAFAALCALPELSHMLGMLRETREQARFRLSEAEEALYTELSRDGVHAWSQLYDATSGGLRIEVDRGAGPEKLSPGQVFNLLHSDDRDLRARAFAAWQSGWRSVARTCATALTHITGTRLTLNQRRGLDPLEEPLAGARITRQTLDAMIEAARRARPLMHRYLALKAKAMGLERLAWHDCYALIGAAGGQVSYEEAQTFIVDQFRAFSPAMADFSIRAFEQGWIEVEDRAGKRGGGFCAGVPLHHASRIFMTWGGKASNVSTLAHELGHAFHNEVLYRRPVSQRRLPMTLAETASTFGEALVREATLAAATDPGQRLRLLDDSLSSALAFLCNIPARMELELALYRLRANGPLSPADLEAETTRIFAEWYGPTLEAPDATFWANKLHFYIGSVAFYNFPYTFGYLFSALVYEHFRAQGAEGAPRYEALLERTGDEPAEQVAAEGLGLDLGDPEVWMKAMGMIRRDLDAFEALLYPRQEARPCTPTPTTPPSRPPSTTAGWRGPSPCSTTRATSSSSASSQAACSWSPPGSACSSPVPTCPTSPSPTGSSSALASWIASS